MQWIFWILCYTLGIFRGVPIIICSCIRLVWGREASFLQRFHCNNRPILIIPQTCIVINSRLRDPCFPRMCQPPYSYHHIVNLTTDNNLFNVRANIHSGSLAYHSLFFALSFILILCSTIIIYNKTWFIPKYRQYSSSLSIFLQIKVDQQVISGNQDFPEGGFDGFLQSIVCKKVCVEQKQIIAQ